MPSNPPFISERTRASADPVRNFKFAVEFFHTNGAIQTSLAKMGFTSVEGLSMSTEVSNYREGGWNTNPHKLPGQTDFAPITLTSGVFMDKDGMWQAAKQMFSAQWGAGNLATKQEFRFDMGIKVYDHPVTNGDIFGDNAAVLGFRVYNGWVANVAYGGLNAGDSNILIHNMTIHHEGLEVAYDTAAANTLI
jgi:hypothetical protein